ncbi:MAG: response regulator, partial [Planctomycetota bacterium]
MAKQPVARVLVIDDEPDLRELMADALASEDVEILTAGTAQEAADVAAKNLVDLVVADLHLPDGTGADVIGNLRGLLHDLPAVVVTGVKEAETLADATRVGLVELMTKPLDIQRLKDTVHRELDSQRSRRRSHHRTLRLRDLARAVNIERKEMGQQIDSTCEDLTNSYRQLSGQMAIQQIVLNYQSQLVSAKTDDDVFRALFQTFVKRSGPLFGTAM